ncbi:UNKNOWN [Stylonychia lemnae]|uniref:Transmembrane protein n=1 Tax=Stylonychia lemnae TaxID=5949 RepID=A0A078AVL5_STYLE|nr:UNKNOWN [Stylonychia lemnae]|eukprot:CDW86229.1 UNKNOWN [Stylonychia lemnae]
MCLLLCGNFGPLPFKVDEQSCGIHNDCSRAHQDDMRLNFTAQVVGSYSPKLLETCQDHVISVDAHFQQMRNDYFVLKRQCEPLEIIFVQNLFPYNLIKAEFQGNENEEDLLKNIYNIEIEYIGRNPYHRKFQAIVGLIFITANIIMIINFYKVDISRVGQQLQYQQFNSLNKFQGMIPYNFPYKFFISTQAMLGQFDAFFNTTFICAILMANMVILDSLHTTQGKIWSFYLFYRAKILVIVFVWVMLFGYVFTEHLINLESHLITNNYHPQSIGIQIIRVNLNHNSQLSQKFYLIAIVIYFIAAVYYIHKAIQKVLAVTIEMSDFHTGKQGDDSIDLNELEEGYTMGNPTSEDRKFFREKNKIEVKDS